MLQAILFIADQSVYKSTRSRQDSQYDTKTNFSVDDIWCVRETWD